MIITTNANEYISFRCRMYQPNLTNVWIELTIYILNLTSVLAHFQKIFDGFYFAVKWLSSSEISRLVSTSCTGLDSETGDSGLSPRRDYQAVFKREGIHVYNALHPPSTLPSPPPWELEWIQETQWNTMNTRKQQGVGRYWSYD